MNNFKKVLSVFLASTLLTSPIFASVQLHSQNNDNRINNNTQIEGIGFFDEITNLKRLRANYIPLYNKEDVSQEFLNSVSESLQGLDDNSKIYMLSFLENVSGRGITEKNLDILTDHYLSYLLFLKYGNNFSNVDVDMVIHNILISEHMFISILKERNNSKRIRKLSRALRISMGAVLGNDTDMERVDELSNEIISDEAFNFASSSYMPSYILV